MSATEQTSDGDLDYLPPSMEGHLWEGGMADFHVQPEPDGVLYLSGELEMATAGAFPDEALGNLDGQGHVILDVSELAFIDSTGIRALLELAKRAAPRGVVLRHPRPTVDGVLRIVRMESLGIRVER